MHISLASLAWPSRGVAVHRSARGISSVTVVAEPGLYVVTARRGDIEAEAQIRVRAAKPDDTDDVEENDDQEKGRKT